MPDYKDSRIIALDIGIKTVGIAVTDPLWLFPRPVGTIKRADAIQKDLDELQKICEQFFVAAFIVGWPLHSDGTETEITPIIRGFEKRVKKIYPETLFYHQDERFSTKDAEEKISLKLKDRQKAKSSGRIDSAAAAVILENFMQIQLFRELKEKFLQIS